MKRFPQHVYARGLILILTLLASCASSATQPTAGGAKPAGGQPNSVTLIIAGYSTPAEAIGKIIPLFQRAWRDKAGQNVRFQQSYAGSGVQSRAVVDGFDADIVMLSLDTDVQRIQDAGLITQDWKANPHNGEMTNSVVVLNVRKGNPKGIKDWNDLTQKGLTILTPDPATSGGAQWNVMAAYGAAKRGFVPGVAKDDDQAAYNLVKGIFKNVVARDKDARTSITRFERGIGDVAITYENEVLLAKQSSQDSDYIIPHSTILIECPIAVVDQYVDKHGTRAAAEAFRDFLWTPDAQKIFSQYGFRSVDPGVAQATAAQFPAVQDQFQITYFGGWPAVAQQWFSSTGTYSKLTQEVQQEQSQ